MNNKRYIRSNYNDFYTWCRKKVSYARQVIGYCDKHDDYKKRYYDEYMREKTILEKYEALQFALSEEENTVLKLIIENDNIPNDRHTWNLIADIFDCWKETYFSDRRLVLKQLNQEIICDNLKYLRIVNNYSGKYLADLIEIDFSTYKSYESGERLIRIDVLYGLAQIYGYTIEQLLEKKLNYI